MTNAELTAVANELQRWAIALRYSQGRDYRSGRSNTEDTYTMATLKDMERSVRSKRDLRQK